jgi:hypothetical protein
MVLLLCDEQSNQYGFLKDGERKDVIVNYYSLVRAVSSGRGEVYREQLRESFRQAIKIILQVWRIFNNHCTKISTTQYM